MSNSAIQSLFISGQQVDLDITNNEITVEASFDDDNPQGAITLDQFTLPPESRALINGQIEGGLTGGIGIFEGPEFELTAHNSDQSITTFDGFIDTANEYEDLIEEGTSKVRIKSNFDLGELQERIEALTYGFLEAKGLVGESDYVTVDYVVDKKDNAVDILISLIILYLMIKELNESISRTADSIAKVAAFFGTGITGPAVSVAYSIAVAAINLVYTIAIGIAIIQLGRDLINTFIPPKRQHKAIRLRRALEVVATRLGYAFVSPIEELDKLVYLPSNPNLDEFDAAGFIKLVKGTQKGIPNTQDYGYNCLDMFQLCKDQFRAKLSVIGGELHLRALNDPFWVKQSTFDLSVSDPLIKLKTYNTDEIVFDKIIQFDTDITDEWTLDNFKGTNYEIFTEAITVKNQDAVSIKGNEQIRLPVCLGSRKDELNALENILFTIASSIDTLAGILGGRSNLAKSVETKIGVLKTSSNFHSKPKLLWLEGDRLPVNHRDLFSAKTLYNKYINYDSFVLNNFNGQKIVYPNVRIPFGLNDFVNVIENSYFKFNGESAKITQLEWNIEDDEAVASFWVRKPYTKNLKETTIEAE